MRGGSSAIRDWSPQEIIPSNRIVYFTDFYFKMVFFSSFSLFFFLFFSFSLLFFFLFLIFFCCSVVLFFLFFYFLSFIFLFSFSFFFFQCVMLRKGHSGLNKAPAKEESRQRKAKRRERSDQVC